MRERKHFDSKHSNDNDSGNARSQVILSLDRGLSGGRLDAGGSLDTLRRSPVDVLSRTLLGAFGGAGEEVDNLSEFVLGDVDTGVQGVANALNELVGASGCLDIADTNFLCKKRHEKM